MDNKAFKKLIALIETDANPDAEHAMIGSGMHEGTRAIGDKGLMPATIKDLARESGSPFDKLIQEADPEAIQEMLASNPEKYEQYASMMADKTTSDTPEDQAVKWRWGQNITPEQLEQIKKDNPQYLQRISDKIGEGGLKSEMPQIAIPALQKAINAVPPKEVLYNKIRSKLKGRP